MDDEPVVRKNAAGVRHCTEKDPETGFTLPAVVEDGNLYWLRDGKFHRTDKDPVTGLTLPAQRRADGSCTRAARSAALVARSYTSGNKREVRASPWSPPITLGRVRREPLASK